MILFSNAKINVGLNIINKRPDSYHNIESIFLPINLCDVIEIIPCNKFELTIYGHNIESSIENNLCFKAFDLLKKEFALPNVHIILFKNIPTGAGLGGGSSNASFVLKGLNEMFQLSLTTEQLTNLAEKLGSDCPFFINNKSSFATEKGNVLQPIDLNLYNYHVVVVKENIHIPTSWAYSLITPQLPKKKVIEVIQTVPITEWKHHLINDFEEPIFKYYPKLKEIKEWLYKNGAIYASMTGSGSAIFGIFDKKPELDFQKNYFYWAGTFI